MLTKFNVVTTSLLLMHTQILKLVPVINPMVGPILALVICRLPQAIYLQSAWYISVVRIMCPCDLPKMYTHSSDLQPSGSGLSVGPMIQL